MAKWNDLSMQERAKEIRKLVSLRLFGNGGGLGSIELVRSRYEDLYNTDDDIYKLGGHLSKKQKENRLALFETIAYNDKYGNRFGSGGNTDNTGELFPYAYSNMIELPDAIANNPSVMLANTKLYMNDLTLYMNLKQYDDWYKYYPNEMAIMDSDDGQMSPEEIGLFKPYLDASGLNYRLVIDHPGWYQLLDKEGIPTDNIISSRPLSDAKASLDNYVNGLGYGNVLGTYFVTDTRTPEERRRDLFWKDYTDNGGDLATAGLRLGENTNSANPRDKYQSVLHSKMNALEAAKAVPEWLGWTFAEPLMVAKLGYSAYDKLTDNDPSNDWLGYLDAGTALVPMAARGGKKLILAGDLIAREAYAPYDLLRTASEWDGRTVSDKYFSGPNNWYRIASLPEVETMQELGHNVTATDAKKFPSQADIFRRKILRSEWSPVEDPIAAYKKDPKFNPSLEQIGHKGSRGINLTKSGSAHGNTTLASKGELWSGTTSGSGKFKTVVLEGDMPTLILTTATEKDPAGKVKRSDFNLQDSEKLPTGTRVGFHTGDLEAGDHISYFIPNKYSEGYSYMGPVLPNKTITVIDETNYMNASPSAWGRAVAQAEGNELELLRLRDLHFRLSFPNSVLVDETGTPNTFRDLHFNLRFLPKRALVAEAGKPKTLYHTTDTEIDVPYTTGNPKGTGSSFGEGFYTAPSEELAKEGPITYKLYGNMEDPNKIWTIEDWVNANKEDYTGGDGIIARKSNRHPEPEDYTDIVFRNPELVKLADAVTYFKEGDPEIGLTNPYTNEIILPGSEIPLPWRDNPNDSRMRFIWGAPMGIGLGAGLFGNSLKAYGGNLFGEGGLQDSNTELLELNKDFSNAGTLLSQDLRSSSLPANMDKYIQSKAFNTYESRKDELEPLGITYLDLVSRGNDIAANTPIYMEDKYPKLKNYWDGSSWEGLYNPMNYGDGSYGLILINPWVPYTKNTGSHEVDHALLYNLTPHLSKPIMSDAAYDTYMTAVPRGVWESYNDGDYGAVEILNAFRDAINRYIDENPSMSPLLVREAFLNMPIDELVNRLRNANSYMSNFLILKTPEYRNLVLEREDYIKLNYPDVDPEVFNEIDRLYSYPDRYRAVMRTIPLHKEMQLEDIKKYQELANSPSINSEEKKYYDGRVQYAKGVILRAKDDILKKYGKYAADLFTEYDSTSFDPNVKKILIPKSLSNYSKYINDYYGVGDPIKFNGRPTVWEVIGNDDINPISYKYYNYDWDPTKVDTGKRSINKKQEEAVRKAWDFSSLNSPKLNILLNSEDNNYFGDNWAALGGRLF